MTGDRVPCQAGSTVEAVLVAIILLLTPGSPVVVSAEAPSHILQPMFSTSNCLTHSPVVAENLGTGLFTNQLRVAESPSEVCRTGTDFPPSQVDTSASIGTALESVTEVKITQQGLTLRTKVLTGAGTTALPSDCVAVPMSPMPTVLGEALVKLTLPPMVHAVRTLALGLAPNKVAGSVMLALEALASIWLSTGGAGESLRTYTAWEKSGRVKDTASWATLQSRTGITLCSLEWSLADTGDLQCERIRSASGIVETFGLAVCII